MFEKKSKEEPNTDVKPIISVRVECYNIKNEVWNAIIAGVTFSHAKPNKIRLRHRIIGNRTAAEVKFVLLNQRAEDKYGAKMH